MTGCLLSLAELEANALAAALPPGLTHPPATDTLTPDELRACIMANFRANSGAPAEQLGELLDQVRYSLHSILRFGKNESLNRRLNAAWSPWMLCNTCVYVMTGSSL